MRMLQLDCRFQKDKNKKRNKAKYLKEIWQNFLSKYPKVIKNCRLPGYQEDYGKTEAATVGLPQGYYAL